MLTRSVLAVAAAASFFLGALTAAEAGPHGQPPPPPPPRPAQSPFPGQRFVQVLRGVNLSNDQQSRIRSLIESTRQANQGVDPQTRRANVQHMREGIWQTLTPEQQAQFRDQLRQQQLQPGTPGP